MEGRRNPRAGRFDAIAALAARALPSNFAPRLEQARLDARMVLDRASGRSPAPLLRDVAPPIPLSEIDPIEALPRALVEKVQTVRRDVHMLVNRLIRGKAPSPLIERPRAAPGAVVSLPGRAPNIARPLSVVKVVRETEDAVSIYVTESDGSLVKFRPGQFLSVDVMVDGERLRRAYSLSSACVDGVPTHITVKRIAGGRVSNQLNDTISEGDELAVLGPSGSFIVEPRAVNQRHLIMIAGGSGITPIISILETVLRVEPHSQVTLIYGNRGWNDVIFRDRLQRLGDEFGDRLTVDHVLEQPPEWWTGERGLLTCDILESRIEALGLQDDGMQRYFICGPTPMMDAAHAVLAKRGVSPNRIAEERFTNPEARSTVRGSATTERVLIARAGHEHGVQVEPDQTILEAALAANVDMPFSCAMGGCGACRVHLDEGHVEMEEPNCLSRAEREQGYVLTCIGRPLGTAKIRVEDA
jgi:ring-1,2-phenylacetyl-CoA epoxidase subunit PaaE